MSKVDFVKHLKEKGGFPTVAAAENAYDSFLACMEETILKERGLVFIGFGSFKVVSKKARKGRNPRTGKEIAIAASQNLKFTPSKKIKDAL